MIDEFFMGRILQDPTPFFLYLGLGGKVKQLQVKIEFDLSRSGPVQFPIRGE
ncbi:Amidase domain-containing protein [Psidium guajava]|nr:Amidase domain-containing protein [Psidium guajava]